MYVTMATSSTMISRPAQDNDDNKSRPSQACTYTTANERVIIRRYLECRRRIRRLREADWLRAVFTSTLSSWRASYADRVSPLHHVLHVIPWQYAQACATSFKNRAGGLDAERECTLAPRGLETNIGDVKIPPGST